MMNISSQTKCLLIVAALLLLIYFIYTQNNQPIHNDGKLSYDNEKMQGAPERVKGSGEISNDYKFVKNMDNNVQMPPGIPAPGSCGNKAQMVNDMVTTDNRSNSSDDSASVASNESDVERQNMPGNKENQILLKRMTGKNHTKGGYKRINYTDGVRGNVSPAEWENYFNKNNELLEDSQQKCENGDFAPLDETKNSFANYKPNKIQKKQKDEDLFDVDQLLPQEVNQDWFEVMPEPIAVKNRHLINIAKPIGINTIGSSLKNPSYDLRGTPPNPKFVVSPWLQSSIEPDLNNRGMCY
ncbi:MAG: hypothetical protein Edafosvirus36_5 [Edafosvirus sp.]|uniref:Minor capsid protein P11 C-terminal conserved region domain-containing protein n=1 Tax=Edafosvirus sp. TaxID=2487765 RepID=A0A3G4ZV94_9VIRU|nr:MAG: hypothetical protein Edafosvirus36_5 [Edafosvirus sp.]